MGPPGEAGPPGQAGRDYNPEELDALRRLTNEFRQELTSLGTNVNAINARLDRLARDVADIQDQLRRMPKITGGAFVGIRLDRGNTYVDRDGRVLGLGVPGNPFGPLGDLRNSPAVIHQLQLGVVARVGADTTLTAHLNSDNYKNYLGGMPGVPYSGLLGSVPAFTTLNPNAPADTYVDQLQLDAAMPGLGKEGGLTIGRYLYNISPLTLWRPEVDTYFLNPMFNDGKYRLDGFKVNTNFGSLGFQVFGGLTRSVQGTNGLPYNSPMIGMSTAEPGIFAGGTKPHAQPLQGQIVMDEIGGVGLSVPVHLLEGGQIRATAFHSTGRDILGGGGKFTNVSLLGAGFDLRFNTRVNASAEYAKTMTGRGKDIANRLTYQNEAFNVNAGFSSGALNVTAGYKYIDPLFYAPGYWGRIGNWINPVNIQGPTFRAGYDFGPTMGLNVGGDFYWAARNRDNRGSLGRDDEINRVLVGMRWDVSKSFKATVDWEGVFWTLSGTHGGAFPANTGKVHPFEQYINIGAGYSVNESTVLRLGYQIGNFNGHNALFGGGPTGTGYNYNAFTSQVAVRF